ncbi:hypothetical protein G7Y79_00020g048800 [Physcia stellaris]|nr:hypothetical protein G7Y79_00020g048800 [Physcia stellaris]
MLERTFQSSPTSAPPDRVYGLSTVDSFSSRPTGTTAATREIESSRSDSTPEERSETTFEELISQIGHTVCRKIPTLQSPNAFLILVTACHIFNLCLLVHNLWVAVVGFPAHLSFLATTAAASVASWIFGTATYGIQTGGSWIADIATYGIRAGGICVSHMASTSAMSVAALVEEVANDFVATAERNGKLRSTSVNLAVFETEIHSLEMSLRIGKYESQIKMEDYTTRMPALSNSLGDSVSNNSASSGILLLATESLNRTLSSLAQEQSEPSLSYLIKEASRRLLGFWFPFICLQAELLKRIKNG